MSSSIASILIFVIRVLGAFLGYISLMIITRGSTIQVVSNYTLITSTLSILYILGNFGYENAILFYFTKYNNMKFIKSVANDLIKANIFTGIVALILYFILPWAEIRPPIEVYFIGTTTIFLQSMLMLSRCSQQVSENYLLAPIPENVLRPAFFVVFIALFYFILDFGLSLLTILISLSASYLLSCLISYFFWKKFTTIHKYGASLNNKVITSIRKSARDFFEIQFFNQLPNFIVVFLIGYLTTDVSGVASFRVAFQTATLIGFGLRSIESIFVSKISAAFHKNNFEEVSINYQRMRTMSLFSGILLCSSGIILSSILPLLFGDNLSNLVSYFVLLCIQQYLNSALGSADYLMMMTGNQNIVRNVSFLQTLVCLFSSLIFIFYFGVIGACISLIASTIFFKLVLSILSQRYLTLQTNTMQYLVRFLMGSLFLIFCIYVKSIAARLLSGLF